MNSRLQREYEKHINKKLESLKNQLYPCTLLIRGSDGTVLAYLEVITKHNSEDRNVIKDLKDWRDANQMYFPSQFKVTTKGTESWVTNQLLNKKDRILFFIKDLKGGRIGHVGLYRFDYLKKSCEIDNVIRGKDSNPGLMTLALKTIINWTYIELQIKTLYLTVFADNDRAIALYERCSFEKVKYIPLRKETKGDTVNWVEVSENDKNSFDRQYLVMKHILRK